MNQWKRNPFPRRHVHRWKIETREKARPSGHWRGPAPEKLQRLCDDCGERMHAYTHDLASLVPGYEAIADILWLPGKIPMEPTQLMAASPVSAPTTFWPYINQHVRSKGGSYEGVVTAYDPVKRKLWVQYTAPPSLAGQHGKVAIDWDRVEEVL